MSASKIYILSITIAIVSNKSTSKLSSKYAIEFYKYIASVLKSSTMSFTLELFMYAYRNKFILLFEQC